MSCTMVRSGGRWEENRSSKGLLTSAHARGWTSGHHTKPENVAPSAAAVQSMLKTKTEVGVGLPTFAKLPSPAQRRARIRPQACDPSRKFGRFDALAARDHRGQIYRTSTGSSRQNSPCYVAERPSHRPISNLRPRPIPGVYRGVARGPSLVLGSAPGAGRHQHFAGPLEDGPARAGRDLSQSYIPVPSRSSAVKTGWPTPADLFYPYHWSRTDPEPASCAANTARSLAISADCGHGYLGHSINHRSSLQESALPRASRCFQELTRQAIQMPPSLFSSSDSSRQATPELRQLTSWSRTELEEEQSIKPLFYDYTEAFGEDDASSIAHCRKPTLHNRNLREDCGYAVRSPVPACRRRVATEVFGVKRNEANLQNSVTLSHEDILAADAADFRPADSGKELHNALLPAPLRFLRSAHVPPNAERSQPHVSGKGPTGGFIDVDAGRALGHAHETLKTPFSTPSIRRSRIASYSPKWSDYGGGVINHDHACPPSDERSGSRHQLETNSDIDIADESLSEREWRLLTLNDEAQAGTLSQLNMYGMAAKDRRVTSSKTLRRSVRATLRNSIGDHEPRDDRRIMEAGNGMHVENFPLETAEIAPNGEVTVSHGKQDPADPPTKSTPLRLLSDAGARSSITDMPSPASGPMPLRLDQNSKRDSGQVVLEEFVGRDSCQKQLSGSTSVGRTGADSKSSSNSSLRLPHAEAAVSLSSLEPQPWNLDKSYPWASSSPNIHVELPEAKDPPVTPPPKHRKLKWKFFKRPFCARILFRHKARSPSSPSCDRTHATIHDVVAKNDHPDPERSASESSSTGIERKVPCTADDNRPNIPTDAEGPAPGMSNDQNAQQDPPCLLFSPVTCENPIEMHSVFSDSSSEEYSRPSVRRRLCSLRSRIVASSGLGVSCRTGGASSSLRPPPTFKTSTESGKQRLTAEGCKSIRAGPRKRMDKLRRWIRRRREDISRLKRRPTRRTKMAT